MKFTIKNIPAEKQNANTVIIGLYEGSKLTNAANQIDKTLKGHIKKLIKQGHFHGKAGEILPLFGLTDPAFEQIILVGFGKSGKTSAMQYQSTLQKAFDRLSKSSPGKVACYLTDIKVSDLSEAWKTKQIAQAFYETYYRFNAFKSKADTIKEPKELIININENKQLKQCQKALDQGRAIGMGMTLTKDLANAPSNYCTPTFLAEQAKELAKKYSKLSLKVLGEKEMAKLGMGSLLGVSQGSAEEAKLICFDYKGGKKSDAPHALVGKGITFDTGGNSLKPADSMVGMKYDMCGAASVFGSLKAVAELNLPINVVGIIAAVENMPGGHAYKPEDILTSMSGKTIEVISTDAEGRLVLADALTYCEKYKPQSVIDIATLTGAVVIALGDKATGILANNDKIAAELVQAGQESNDRGWQLPLWEEYQEQLNSPFADMANVGGRSAGTITAGCFLARFAEKFNWAHLDVAGTAANMAGQTTRNATGRPVPMLVQYLLNQCKAAV